MSLYDHLDYLIVERIRLGARHLSYIFVDDVLKEASRIAAADNRYISSVIDNRIVVLKSKGLIKFEPGCGWVVCQSAPQAQGRVDHG